MPPAKPKVIKTCPVCNKIFGIKPSHSFQVCCSKKCGYVYKTGKTTSLKGVPKSTIHRQHLSESKIRNGSSRKERNSNWKGGKIKFNCTICGKEILIGLYEKETRKTCGSKSCVKQIFSLGRTGERNPNYKPKVKKVCPICQKLFEVKPSHDFQTCCSTKCMGIWRSKNLSGENSPIWKPKIKFNCNECGKEIMRNPYKAKENLKYGHFCSIGCLSKWKSKHICKENHWNWQGGIDSYPYCIKWTDEFRERVRAYYGYICIECGTPQFALKGKFKRLSIHHVNYDKDTCCNDKEPLFVCLCNSCNAKANGNKKGKPRAWWQQHFTEWIYGYYGGKCYLSKEEMLAYTF